MQVGTVARGWQASQHSHTEGLGPELLRLSTCNSLTAVVVQEGHMHPRQVGHQASSNLFPAQTPPIFQ